MGERAGGTQLFSKVSLKDTSRLHQPRLQHALCLTMDVAPAYGKPLVKRSHGSYRWVTPGPRKAPATNGSCLITHIGRL